jgi:hypothetical protein
LKRRGKSSPLAKQFARQEKPHAVQDKTEGGQPARRPSGIVASRRIKIRRAPSPVLRVKMSILARRQQNWCWVR